MKIKTIEIKQTSTGKDYKRCELEDKILDEKYFNVFQFHPKYTEIAVGTDVPETEFEKDGKYLSLKNPQAEKRTMGRSAVVAQAQERKAQNISQAQERNETMWAKYGACLLVANHPAYKDLESSADIERVTKSLANEIKNWELDPF